MGRVRLQFPTLIPHTAEFKRSIDAVRRYLTDRRPKLDGVLKTFGITPSQSHKVSPLSEATVAELREIPSMPLTTLTPDQLIRFAQVVYTALFKSYLLTMPGLLGSLCRIENWCEVSEVEALLREREVRADPLSTRQDRRLGTLLIFSLYRNSRS